MVIQATTRTDLHQRSRLDVARGQEANELAHSSHGVQIVLKGAVSDTRFGRVDLKDVDNEKGEEEAKKKTILVIAGPQKHHLVPSPSRLPLLWPMHSRVSYLCATKLLVCHFLVRD